MNSYENEFPPSLGNDGIIQSDKIFGPSVIEYEINFERIRQIEYIVFIFARTFVVTTTFVTH